MSLVRRLLALRSCPPFDRLSEAEAVSVADAAIERHFAPGEVVAPAQRPLNHLHVITDGSLLVGGDERTRVVGAVALLNGQLLPTPLVAGPSGAAVILLARPHVFTLITECPWLLVDLISDGGHH